MKKIIQCIVSVGFLVVGIAYIFTKLNSANTSQKKMYQNKNNHRNNECTNVLQKEVAYDIEETRARSFNSIQERHMDASKIIKSSIDNIYNSDAGKSTHEGELNSISNELDELLKEKF